MSLSCTGHHEGPFFCKEDGSTACHRCGDRVSRDQLLSHAMRMYERPLAPDPQELSGAVKRERRGSA